MIRRDAFLCRPRVTPAAFAGLCLQVAAITPADVVWTCKLLVRLSDEQGAGAFRAANYPHVLAARFVAKLKAKVQEGLALETRASVTYP